jgi:hypothetical protein
MIIEFGHIGKQLGTRIAGASVREQIVDAIKNDQKVVFDFTGVEVVSNSFADECFAKLTLFFSLDKVKESTHFQNASPFIKAVIANSFKERLSVLNSA